MLGAQPTREDESIREDEPTGEDGSALPSPGGRTMALLLVESAGLRIGLPAAASAGVHDDVAVTGLPGLRPPWIGVTAIGSDVVAVADLAWALGDRRTSPAGPGAPATVVRLRADEAAVLVDRWIGLREIEAQDVRRAAETGNAGMADGLAGHPIAGHPALLGVVPGAPPVVLLDPLQVLHEPVGGLPPSGRRPPGPAAGWEAVT